MIGLKRKTVRLMEHKAEWSEFFGAEAATIHQHIGDIVADIQHVGSTSVLGLPAKPILDIAVGVSSSEVIEKVAERLSRIGYIDRGDGGRDGGYLLVKESEPDVRTIHVHIVELTDTQWRNYIGFRDILRQDVAIRQKYAELKQQLAEKFRDDRKSYTSAKSDFIRGILSEKFGDK